MSFNHDGMSETITIPKHVEGYKRKSDHVIVIRVLVLNDGY